VSLRACKETNIQQFLQTPQESGEAPTINKTNTLAINIIDSKTIKSQIIANRNDHAQLVMILFSMFNENIIMKAIQTTIVMKAKAIPIQYRTLSNLALL
jgi:hypothetical protein